MLSLKRFCACCFVSESGSRADSHPREDKIHNQNDITNQNEGQSLHEKNPSNKTIKEQPKLKIVIIDSQELEVGKEYIMTSLGIKGKTQRINDGCIYGGCDPIINDIILSEKEKGVGKRHFMIQYDKKFKNKFAIRDLGEGMGTFIRIESHLHLKTNNIISFGDSHMITSIDFNEGSKITLKFIDGPKVDQKFTFMINDCPINIGRMADCSIRFDDSSMSRYHCFIGFDNAWYIQDGDGYKPSTNGTWLFGEEFVEISDQMVFKAAETLFKIQLDGEA